MKDFFEQKRLHDLVIKILLEQSQGKMCMMGSESRSDSNKFYDNLKKLTNDVRNIGWNRLYRDAPDLIIPCINLVIEIGVCTLRKNSLFTGNVIIDFNKVMMIKNLSSYLQENYIYLMLGKDLVLSDILKPDCTEEQVKRHLPMCILTTGKKLFESVEFCDKNYVRSLIPGYWYKGDKYLQKLIKGDKIVFSKEDIIGNKESLAGLKEFAKQFEGG